MIDRLSDLQLPSGQSRPGSFTSLHSKAKDLVTRHARQPKPSQNSAQLTVPEEGANELLNMGVNHPRLVQSRAPALPTPAPALLDSPRGGAPPAPRKTAVWTAMTPPPGAMTPPLA
ncbi:uncharacterized protein F5147DRAFT_777071 [Suillus discolor]|uniref:Uncharacterized protein n=1 Tax=Suillus discolor TaxID=1912936 RepID=A0A9P7F0Z1_9AGAM|nr:uncharacterized protein F5147DRAFT_777071 [Suillus discolor]KAG2100166.1 hypothetical protein F5147DRAFT_777071 [Suillus discolor]